MAVERRVPLCTSSVRSAPSGGRGARQAPPPAGVGSWRPAGRTPPPACFCPALRLRSYLCVCLKPEKSAWQTVRSPRTHYLALPCRAAVRAVRTWPVPGPRQASSTKTHAIQLLTSPKRHGHRAGLPTSSRRAVSPPLPSQTQRTDTSIFRSQDT